MAGIITKLELSVGGTSYEVYSAPSGETTSCEAVEVTSMSDETAKYVAGAVIRSDAVTFTLYGTAPTLSREKVEVSLTGTTTSGQISAAFSGFITNITPATVSADGDRRQMFDITIQPEG